MQRIADLERELAAARAECDKEFDRAERHRLDAFLLREELVKARKVRNRSGVAQRAAVMDESERCVKAVEQQPQGAEKQCALCPDCGWPKKDTRTTITVLPPTLPNLPYRYRYCPRCGWVTKPQGGEVRK
jgi:hypothetical protein